MQHRDETATLASIGRTLGAKAGAGVGVVYLVGLVLVIVIDALRMQPSDASYLPLVLLYLFIGPAVGVLPATLIGMFSGWVIGVVVDQHEARLAPWSAVLVGLMLTGVFAACINIFIWPWGWICVLFAAGDCAAYWAYLGVPSAIYILLGGGVGGWLYQQRNSV